MNNPIELLAGVDMTAAPISIPLALAITLSIAFIVLRWLISVSWKGKGRAILAVGAGLAGTAALGRMRGGDSKHILFLFAVVMLFMVVKSSSSLYMARKYAREKHLPRRSGDEWYVYFNRNAILIASALSLAMFYAQVLPIW